MRFLVELYFLATLVQIRVRAFYLSIVLRVILYDLVRVTFFFNSSGVCIPQAMAQRTWY